MDRFIKFLRDEEGATAIEYALIAGLIAVILVATLTNVGTAIKDIFVAIKDALIAAKPPAQ